MPIERHFLDWRKPALAAAAEFLRARGERDGVLDLSRVIVVVPGSRAGRRLVEILVSVADERKLELVPPDIVTPDQFPERLYQPKLQFAGPLVQRLAWMQALQSAPVERLAPLLPHPPGAHDTLEWLAIAESLGRLHTELAADGQGCRDVLAGAGAVEGFAEHERWEVLCGLERAYLDTLDRLKLWDVQTARLVAIEKREIATEQTVVLVGMADLNRAQRRMLDLIAERVIALIVAPEELAERFDEHGCLIAAAWTEAELPLLDEQIERADGPADQAEAVTRWMASLGGRYAADEVVIGLGDERLVPHVARQLEQCQVTARFAEAKTMRETGPYRLLKVAADYAVRGRFRDLAALVRQPEVELVIGHSSLVIGKEDALSALDRFAAERFPAQLDVERLAKEERAAEVLAVVQGVDRMVQSLRGEAKALNEWSEGLRAVLLAVYGGKELDRDAPGDRYVLAALENLRDALDTVAAIPGELAPVVDARQACRVALELVADKGLAPPADPAAVELLGWLELPLDDAPALVVTSFNEGLIPKAASADPFLPNRLREALGLLDNNRRLARDAYALSVLLASRKELKVIVGRRDGDGNPLSPSRLLFCADTETVVRRAQHMFGDSPPAPPRRNLLAAASGVAATSKLVVPRPKQLAKAISELSVTKFRDYITCPYRFYLRHVLALESLADDAAELDGGAFGALVHFVLEQFGRSEEASGVRFSADATKVGEYLDHELDRVMGARFGTRHVRPAVRVQVEQARMRLRSFASWQARRAGEGWRIVFGEDSEERRSLTANFPVDGESFTLVGRIDRIDFHEGSRTLAILDYKTADKGEGPERRHRRGEEWVDLQLPLYRHLVESAGIAVGRSAYDAIRLGYILLPRDAAGVSLETADWDENLLRTADEKAREIIRAIREQTFWPPNATPDFAEDVAVICQDHRLGAPRGSEQGDAA